MKKKSITQLIPTHNYILMMAITIICCVSACKKDGDDHLEKWMIANLNAFNAIKTNPEYRELQSPGNEGSIYYKVLQAGDGTDSIRYTSTVTCYYKGYLIADYPEENIEKGKVFDQRLFDDGPPRTFAVMNVINGWKTALQHMVKGDKWEIWVPYQLGYGSAGSSNSIPGYSTLVFEMEITNVKGVDDL